MARICIVLHTHWSSHSGGAELQARFLGEYLHKEGHHQVTHVCRNANPASTPDSNADTVPVVQIPAPKMLGILKRPYFMDAVSLWHTLKRLNPQVIYQRCGSPYTGIVSAYCRHSGTKMVWHIAHEDDLLPLNQVKKGNRLIAWINKRLLNYGIRHTSIIIAQTQDQKVLLKSYHGKSCDAVIYNFHPAPPPPPPKGQKAIVLWVANFKKWKRPEAFITLAERLKDKVDARFIMVGRLDNSPWVTQLKQRGLKLNNLETTGELPLEEVNRLLEQAHLFINTSVREGFPNTFIQSWFRQTPVVSLDVDPDGVLAQHGLGIKSGTEEHMVHDVRHLLNNREKLTAMGLAAREYALKNHSMSNAKRLEALLTRE